MSTGAPDRIADVLVLCMTRGMSLGAWRNSGVLEREWAIYQRLAPHYKHIVVVSYAHSGEREIASRLGAEAIFNESGGPHDTYLRDLPAQSVAKLRALGATSAVVKTNQFEGGDAAVAITAALRAANVTAALIARGGYPWSRFESWKHGTDSPQAARAVAEEAELCRAADAVIGTTPSMVEDLARRYALPRDRLHIVPNYIVPHPATPAPAALPDARPMILAAGRLEPQKRPDMLVRAVAQSGVADSALLRIVGRGPLADDLRKQARRECVTLDLITSLPHANLIAQMRTCTLFVQCSAFEGHPKTVLEALAASACVLVTDTPGLADVVAHGTTGRVTRDSDAALADAIRELMGSPAQRQRLALAARDITARAFDVDHIATVELRVHAQAAANARSHATHEQPLSLAR